MISGSVALLSSFFPTAIVVTKKGILLLISQKLIPNETKASAITGPTCQFHLCSKNMQ